MNAARISQGDKLRELRRVLIDAGFHSLDRQAEALGLARSTTYAVLRGDHKCAGLRAALVARMWRAPGLPPAARQVLLDYIAEKSGGAYGHSDDKRKRFVAQLEQFDININGRN